MWRALLLLLALGRLSHSYPDYFVSSYAGSCSDHPTQGFGKHGTPTLSCEDTDMELVADAGQGTYCAGGSYTLKITFPTERRFLITASAPILPSKDCDGTRLVWGQDQVSVRQRNISVQIPCGVTGNIAFKITSAGGMVDNYHQCQLFYTVKPGCMIDKCANATTQNAVPAVQTTARPPTLSTPSSPKLPACQAPCSKFLTIEQGSCSASSLGYGCSSKMDDLTLHWSIASCIPVNKCTEAISWQGECTAQDSHTKYLHILAEASVNGYIAVSFASKSTSMLYADAVIGWITADGTGSVTAYPISQYQVSPLSRYSTASKLLSYTGIVRLSNQRLLLCFARPLSVPSAIYSSNIMSNSTININWAIGSSARLTKHDKARSTKMDLDSGELLVMTGERRTVRRVHALLMLLDWALLMPLAALFARHKDAFQHQCAGDTPIWIMIHWWLQAIALTLQVTSLAIVLIGVPGGFRLWKNRWYAVHGILGLFIFGLNVLQLAGVMGRPAPESRWRNLWQKMHVSTGRFLFLLAVVNISIGIHLLWVFQAEAWWRWVLPLLLCYALLALVEYWMRKFKARVTTSTHTPVIYVGAQLNRRHSFLQMVQASRLPMYYTNRRASLESAPDLT